MTWGGTENRAGQEGGNHKGKTNGRTEGGAALELSACSSISWETTARGKKKEAKTIWKRGEHLKKGNRP